MLKNVKGRKRKRDQFPVIEHRTWKKIVFFSILVFIIIIHELHRLESEHREKMDRKIVCVFPWFSARVERTFKAHKFSWKFQNLRSNNLRLYETQEGKLKKFIFINFVSNSIYHQIERLLKSTKFHQQYFSTWEKFQISLRFSTSTWFKYFMKICWLISNAAQSSHNVSIHYCMKFYGLLTFASFYISCFHFSLE